MLLLRSLLSRELILLGLHDLRAHKLRSFLTALGIVFGVAAVIAMLSIGEGANAEQLESIRLLGSQNIIVRSVEPPASTEARQGNTRMNQYGILRDDVERIAELPHVKQVARLREVGDTITSGSRRFAGTVLGTTENYFDVVNLTIERGRALGAVDALKADKVCVIGADVGQELFPGLDPLDQTVTVLSSTSGLVPFRVVGILSRVATAGEPARGKGARNVNRDVYIPLATAEFRYGDLIIKRARGQFEAKMVQLSDLYIQADSQDVVMALSQVVARVLQYAHKESDFNIFVPLELLQQIERTKRISQIVLGSIAGISLLVGGIGIMNIMLASVTERTREIGIRRALGAKRHHITAQFLIETVILSVAGGLIGIVVGIGTAKIVTTLVEWETIIPIWGVVVSFLVSALVGISFGLYPARAAAALDPIEALRYE